jgi:hypothetical protein
MHYECNVHTMLNAYCDLDALCSFAIPINELLRSTESFDLCVSYVTVHHLSSDFDDPLPLLRLRFKCDCECVLFVLAVECFRFYV